MLAMRRSERKVITCGIYRPDAGQMRAGHGPEDLLRSQVAIEIGAAREIAAEWRQAVIAKGFVELPREA
jgi:hypothetical protein